MQHKDATNHGIDISASRLDDIDREVVSFALGYKGKKVAVDIGCGSGRVSIILALIGFDVWLYDSQDLNEYFKGVGEALGIQDKLHFKQIDLNNLRGEHLPTDIIISVSQRTLHHLPYENTKNVLELISQRMMRGVGRLFLSISGIESKLAEDYKCSNSPVSDRFCEVGEVGKTVYSITSSVCLYHQDEVVSMVEGVGLTIDKVYKSEFGNIKVLGSKK